MKTRKQILLLLLNFFIFQKIDAQSFMMKNGFLFMFGTHVKIYKRLGLDIHLGGIGERGDVTVKKVYSGFAPFPNENFVEKNKLTTRLFGTFNLYFAFGKLNTTTTKKITKNTEGSF